MSDFSDVDDSDISFADTESSENESDDNDDEVKPLQVSSSMDSRRCRNV
jgi:hypothetical protein